MIPMYIDLIRTVEVNLPPSLLENARNLRKTMTDAEELLWQLLRKRQLKGYKFRRQHPLKKGFILDFYCAEAKLGVEIDGKYHLEAAQMQYDEGRTYEIQAYGIRIVRYKNEEVLNDTERILSEILSEVSSPQPLSITERGSPPSPAWRRGPGDQD
jgi:tRNA modification GTPase